MKFEPQITFVQNQGRHNIDLGLSRERLKTAKSSEDLSTICIIPNSGAIPTKAAQYWLTLASPMNQKFLHLMINGREKNIVYNSTIAQILSDPISSPCKYILTMEENIVPPVDGLLKLFENIGKYDVVGGLIWQTGIENVHPMVYGQPEAIPANFLPIPIEKDQVIPCRGLSTGFTLFKADIFRDPRVPAPWFRTNVFAEAGSKKSRIPDMCFFENIMRFGYKVACDTRVRVGNIDAENSIVW
ncbi:hypothetical protein A2125_00440 [Candidatus Woesebacteria bacterium GWB1_43_5]|uniref:Glycosyltransferase 2-like domain-containing protein n=1 Tax=Candidatus Woesebacteria bacterium GWB1_43_5 TaxID=1802474 RepID=A0A1F7WTX3_9BACT|nr:MAG: hypothetical protein A2125_00440 [Candidatus Woesebacteria bacterium GWB1_43_5]